jgi:hypothetical protein
MNIHIRPPPLKQILVWLFIISIISFAIGGAITYLDGGKSTITARERVIPVNIFTQEAQSAQISFEIDSGAVNITAGDTNALVSGKIRSKNAHDGPHQSYTVVNGTGILSLTQESSFFFDPLEKEDTWDLSLHPDIPVALSIESGAGNISVKTGSLPLTSLTIDAGAGDILVDLSRWKGIHLPVAIQEGLGTLILLLPEKATIGADIDNGLGTRTITGLEGGDGHYFHTSSLVQAPVLSVSINQGLGDLTMRVLPEGSE